MKDVKWYDLWEVKYSAISRGSVWTSEIQRAFHDNPPSQDELTAVVRWMKAAEMWKRAPKLGDFISAIREYRGEHGAGKEGQGCERCNDGWARYRDADGWLDDKDRHYRNHDYHVPCECPRGQHWIQAYPDQYHNRSLWRTVAKIALEQYDAREAA